MSQTLPPISISKSRYMAGKQCAKRLYLEEHEPDTRDEMDEATASVIEGGILVGTLARQNFPGGVLIESSTERGKSVLEQTRDALADPSIPAIFDGVFIYQGTPIQVHALVRAAEDEFELVTVRSSTAIEDHHKNDVAVQLWALQGLGLKIRGVKVLHPRKDYVRTTGDINPTEYFQHTDLTGELDEHLTLIPQELAEQREILQGDSAPEVETGSHCRNPHVCPFYSRCHPAPKQGEYPIDEIPHISNKARNYLRELRHLDIRDIPEGLTYPEEVGKSGKPKKTKEVLSERQKIVWNSVCSGQPYINREGLREAFEKLVYPVHFKDFETAAAVLPIYEGMSPGQPILFQFSVHTLGDNGRLYHREFLQAEEGDPRLPFFKHLRRAVQGEGSIMVYSSFEQSRLEELARAFPNLQADVEQMTGRYVDLLQIIRDNYYHPDMRGSRSIKDVLPILVPGFTYKDLSIQNGAQAQAAYFEMIHPETTPEKRAEISTALLRYCDRDTEAMVKGFMALKRLAYDDPTQAVKNHLTSGGAKRRIGVRR